VIGAVSLLLALYAMQVLPVNYAGLALILTGIGFMIAELFVPSFGALGIGGVIAFIFGSVMLFDRESGGLAISLPLIIAVALVSVAFFLIAVRAVLAAHRKPVVSGSEQLVGASGEVLDDFEGSGFIHIHGETWQARSTVPLKRGSRVRVKSLDGLILSVEPEQEEERA
jgi:membrane-bound serine protease (ClpP class)